MLIEAATVLLVAGGVSLVGKWIVDKRRMAMSSVSVYNGVVTGPTGATYRLTAADRLWLGRALVGETGGNDRRAAAAVAWSMINRFMLKNRRPNGTMKWSSFTNLLRAYCQPLNPAWSTPGQGKCAQRPDMCTDRHIQRRRATQAMSWDSLPYVTRRAVEDFSSGMLENPVGGAVDFAAYRFNGATVNIGGNWFGDTQA